MTDKILIIAPYQFGELSDCYYWAKYATIEGRRVTYIGYKSKTSRLKERYYPGVKVISVPHLNNRIIHGLFFYSIIILTILLGRYNNIIVCSFPGVRVLGKLFSRRNIILDIRTLSISNNPAIRKRMDDNLRRVLHCFPKITAISEGVQKQLKHPSFILPLGAEPLSNKRKEFDKLKFFYIGGFDNRNLDVFLEGLALYQKQTEQPVTFDIVGGGSEQVEEHLRNLVSSRGIKGITFHGYLNHDECEILFDNCNVGVCFVPITDYYQYQPPTKLFEYLLSGMVCIATKTYSNREVINEDNGILIDDTPDSVCEGISKLQAKFHSYDSQVIVGNSSRYHWHRIIKDYFLPLFVA